MFHTLSIKPKWNQYKETFSALYLQGLHLQGLPRVCSRGWGCDLVTNTWLPKTLRLFPGPKTNSKSFLVRLCVSQLNFLKINIILIESTCSFSFWGQRSEHSPVCNDLGPVLPHLCLFSCHWGRPSTEFIAGIEVNVLKLLTGASTRCRLLWRASVLSVVGWALLLWKRTLSWKWNKHCLSWLLACFSSLAGTQCLPSWLSFRRP